MAELVFEPIELIKPTAETTDCMRSVYVTGGPLGPQHRAMDGPGKPVLMDGEDVLLRHGDDWWWVSGDDLSAARAAALKRGRGQSICIDDATHIRATRLPPDAGRRDAWLRQTRPGAQHRRRR